MKKILISALSLALILSFSHLVLAEEAAPKTLPTPRILPGSIIYPFKLLGENIKSIFSFGLEARLERAQELSSMRLAEIKTLVEKEKTNGLNLAAERYQRQQDRLTQIINKSDDLKEDLIERVTDSTNHHLDILDEIMEKSPDEAKSALTRARSVAQRGQIKAIDALPSKAQERHQEVMEQKMDNLENWISLKTEGRAESALGDWQAHLKSLRAINQQNELSPGSVEWSARAIERMDRIENQATEMVQLREQIWQARLEAVESQIEEIKKYREENRWGEIQGNFSESALRRLDMIKQRIEEITSECPDEGKDECLRMRQSMVDALAEEYEKYASLGEEIIEGLEVKSSDQREERLNQAAEQAMEVLEQIYDRAPEEAKMGLNQAIMSTERLRQMTEQILNPENQAFSASESPAVRQIQERVRQEIQPQLERIRGVFDQR